MKFLNIFEKLEILFNLIVNSNIFTFLIISIIGVILFRLKDKISNKKMIFGIYFVELIALGFIFFEGKEFIINTLNIIIDNIFINFYFPSLYVYLFIFIISLIIFIYTLLNKYISKIYRNITYTYYLIFNFIFIILLNVISKNNIDVFSKTNIFTNNEVLVLLELSTLIFFLYLVTNSLIYITNALILFVGERKISISKNTYNPEFEINNPNVVEDNYETKENDSYLPNIEVSFQELVKNINEPVVETSYDSKEPVKEVIINNIEPVTDTVTKIDLVPELKKYINKKEENKEFKFIDPSLISKSNNDALVKEKLNFIDFSILDKTKEEKLTLNDYKLFSNMLKVVIKNSNDKNLSINDILNKVLLNDYSYEEYTKFEKILNSCLN